MRRRRRMTMKTTRMRTRNRCCCCGVAAGAKRAPAAGPLRLLVRPGWRWSLSAGGSAGQPAVPNRRPQPRLATRRSLKWRRASLFGARVCSLRRPVCAPRVPRWPGLAGRSHRLPEPDSGRPHGECAQRFLRSVCSATPLQARAFQWAPRFRQARRATLIGRRRGRRCRVLLQVVSLIL